MEEHRALIADSDENLLRRLRDEMEAKGFSVTTASDGGRAVELIRQEAFQVIVLDLDLPGLRGFQISAIAKSSRLNRDVPIYLISNVVDKASVKQAYKLKIAGVITKPFDPAALADRTAFETGLTDRAPPADLRFINSLSITTYRAFEYYLKRKPRLSPPVARTGPAPGRFYSWMFTVAGPGIVGSVAIRFNEAMVDDLVRIISRGKRTGINEKILRKLTGDFCSQVMTKANLNVRSLGVQITIGRPKGSISDNSNVDHILSMPVVVIPICSGNLVCELEFCFEQNRRDQDKARAESIIIKRVASSLKKSA